MQPVNKPLPVRGPFSREVLHNASWLYPLKAGAPDPLYGRDLKDWNNRERPATPVFPVVPLTEESVLAKPPSRLQPRDLDRFVSWRRRRLPSPYAEHLFRELVAFDWARHDENSLRELASIYGWNAEGLQAVERLRRRRDEATGKLSRFLGHGLEHVAERKESERALRRGDEQRVYKELVARHAENGDWGVCEWCGHLLPRGGIGRPRRRCDTCKPPRVQLAAEWFGGGPDQAITLRGTTIRVESLCAGCGEMFAWSGRRSLHCPSCGAGKARKRRRDQLRRTAGRPPRGDVGV